MSHQSFYTVKASKRPSLLHARKVWPRSQDRGSKLGPHPSQSSFHAVHRPRIKHQPAGRQIVHLAAESQLLYRHARWKSANLVTRAPSGAWSAIISVSTFDRQRKYPPSSKRNWRSPARERERSWSNGAWTMSRYLTQPSLILRVALLTLWARLMSRAQRRKCMRPDKIWSRICAAPEVMMHAARAAQNNQVPFILRRIIRNTLVGGVCNLGLAACTLSRRAPC